jgi:hypothetical protein
MNKTCMDHVCVQPTTLACVTTQLALPFYLPFPSLVLRRAKRTQPGDVLLAEFLEQVPALPD